MQGAEVVAAAAFFADVFVVAVFVVAVFVVAVFVVAAVNVMLYRAAFDFHPLCANFDSSFALCPITGISKAVDIFDLSTGLWSTAELSIERTFLSATSVGSVALFGGGQLRASM